MLSLFLLFGLIPGAGLSQTAGPVPETQAGKTRSAETQPAETRPTVPLEEPDKPLGTILKVDFLGLNSQKEEIVADVATLKVGDVLTREKLENSINDLKNWGVFERVEVLVQYSDDGIELSYDLKEGFIIKDIIIKGNYPLLRSKVQTALFLNPGSIYDHTKLPEQIDRLDRLYEKEGYSGTTVLAIEDYDETKHQVKLYFRIKKGTTYRLRNLNVEGNTVLKPKKIRSIIFTFSHYKPKNIKKDLQKIKDLYSKKGFVRARVRVEKEYFDVPARKVDLDVLIRQGPQVKVEFEGNKHYFKKTLKKQITIYEDGDFDEFELEASKRKLITFYQQRGFEKVEVTWTREKVEVAKKKFKEEEKDFYFLVTFHINEGPQSQIKFIEFIGNDTVSDGTLLKQMASKENSIGEKGYFFQPLFEQDLAVIETYYHEIGYQQAEVLNWEKIYSPLGDRVTLRVEIKEGPLSQVESLKIQGLTEAEEEIVKKDLQLLPGKPYSPQILNQDLQTILIYLANHGHPYATIEHNEKEISPGLYEISLEVNRGDEVTIGRLLFVGNALTQEQAIRRNLRIKEGDVFSTEKILQSTINLRGLGIFDAVNIETLGLTSQRKVVNLVVRVQEKKTKIMDFEVGYNTDEGFKGKFVFNKLNLWGRAKNGNIKLQLGTEVKRAELNYIEPRLFGSSLQLVLGVYAGSEDRPFFTSSTVGGYGTLFKQFTSRLNAYGRLDLNFVDFNQGETIFNQVNPNLQPNQRTRLVTTLGTIFDTRDNFGDPRSGAFLNGSVAFTEEFIQRSAQYLTLRANTGYWYSPLRSFTIANAVRTAQILAYPNGNVVPPDARLYLGGDSTVRGFDQDSLLPSGGNFSLVWNLEFQLRIFYGIQIVGFMDTGVVTKSISDVGLDTIRHSAGPSIRYLTPVGPIRVDWGFVLDPQPTDSTTNRVHFSFGYFF